MIHLPKWSMYPNSIYFGLKVVPCIYYFGTWALRVLVSKCRSNKATHEPAAAYLGVGGGWGVGRAFWFMGAWA